MAYFDLRYLVTQGFFLLSKLYIGLIISLELVEIYKIFGFDFCVKRNIIVL